jgi:choline dehydrogenase
LQTNIRDGVRHGVVEGYPRTAADRANLTVLTDVIVDRLLFAGTAVTGVRVSGRAAGDLRARRAVVVAAGALRSPQLLMRSGIGPAEHLREVGVEVVHDLPGVGRNLQDHPLVVALWPTSHAAAPAASAQAQRQYELLRRGPLSTFMQVAAFRRFAREEPAPDLQFNFGVLPGTAVSPDLVDPVLAVAPILLTPASRGQVRLASSRADVPAVVDPGYLTDERDHDRLLRALVWARDELFAQPEIASLCGPVLLPPPDVDDLGEHVRRHTTSGWHFGGTCRMGIDGDAVVGPDLAVHGVEGLYVADASVMPTLPRGNTQAATIMIAERAGELLARW